MSSVYDALSRYAESAPLRAHMPGHGGCGEALRALSALCPLDVTELSFSGDALTGSGPFAEAYDRADRLYGGTTVFSAGGATLALQAALLLGCGAGGAVLLDRRCHKSVLNAVILLGLVPYYIYSESDGRLSEAALCEAARAHPDAHCAVITSPTYTGLLSPLSAPKGVKLIVDNSHGSHLLLCGEHPFLRGADYCVDSLHKTLPALTGAALLHCRESREAALSALRLFGSTSPSFLISASADLCIDYLLGAAKADFMRLCALLEKLRTELSAMGLATLSGERYDKARLTLDLGGSEFSSQALYSALLEEGVHCEMADFRYIVMILPLTFSEADGSRLLAAIKAALPRSAGALAQCAPQFSPLFCAALPRDAYFSEILELPLCEAFDRICARPLYFYPPGIPLCAPGERLSAEFCKACAPYFNTVFVTTKDI